MNQDFWLRVLIDVVLFALVMKLLFAWYARKPPLTYMTRSLRPDDLTRMGEILFHAGIEVDEGTLEYESGGILISTAPNRGDGLRFQGDLVLRVATPDPEKAQRSHKLIDSYLLDPE
jgi:hypothetical protein